MKKVTIYWKTKDEAKRNRIRDRFCIVHYTSVNGETRTKIRDEDMELLEETERRGYIQIRKKPGD